LISLALIGASGCFLGHAGMDVDSGALDAGRDSGTPPPPLMDGSVPDSSLPPMDSSVPPACSGPAEPTRATRSTVMLAGFGGMALPTDTPFELPISLDEGCYCSEVLLCDVSVRRGEGLSPTVIELNTSMCSRDLGCDECFPRLDGVCEVPALPAGDYRVRLNGEDAYVVSLPVWRSDTQESTTWTPAPLTPAGLFCPWQSTPIATTGELCVPAEAFADASGSITVSDACGGCFDEPADCSVTREGSRLIVEARTRSCDCPTCGACAEICQRITTSCRLPPLPAGSYTVVHGDLHMGLEVVPGLPPFGPVATPMTCAASVSPGGAI